MATPSSLQQFFDLAHVTFAAAQPSAEELQALQLAMGQSLSASPVIEVPGSHNGPLPNVVGPLTPLQPLKHFHPLCHRALQAKSALRNWALTQQLMWYCSSMEMRVMPPLQLLGPGVESLPLTATNAGLALFLCCVGSHPRCLKPRCSNVPPLLMSASLIS
jgi:hypothetical protein